MNSLREFYFMRAAARLLFLTQPTLSYQIRTLEEELGTPLFTRTTCRVEPTEAGQLFAAFEEDKFRPQPDAARTEDVFACDLLIIDDLGTELSNSFTTSQLFLCINERILRQKSTIISTNLGMNQLADIYSERVLSRISSNYTLLKLFGADIRILKRNR